MGQRSHLQSASGCGSGEGLAETALGPQISVHELPCPPASVWMGRMVVRAVVWVMHRSGLWMRLCVYGQSNVNQGVICLPEEQSARGTDSIVGVRTRVHRRAGTGARWCQDDNKVGGQD